MTEKEILQRTVLNVQMAYLHGDFEGAKKLIDTYEAEKKEREKKEKKEVEEKTKRIIEALNEKDPDWRTPFPQVVEEFKKYGALCESDSEDNVVETPKSSIEELYNETLCKVQGETSDERMNSFLSLYQAKIEESHGKN